MIGKIKMPLVINVKPELLSNQIQGVQPLGPAFARGRNPIPEFDMIGAREDETHWSFQYNEIRKKTGVIKYLNIMES